MGRLSKKEIEDRQDNEYTLKDINNIKKGEGKKGKDYFLTQLFWYKKVGLMI